MMFEDKIPATFIQHAADILADTNSGLSGSDIVKATVSYAVECEIQLPHPRYPFEAANKRTALYENLMAFGPTEQYRIIKELCDHRSFALRPSEAKEQRKELKIMLITRYKDFATGGDPDVVEVVDDRHS
jgi:hypothetical protein